MPDSPIGRAPGSAASVEAALQLSVGLHWTAIEQYAAQAAHFERWGYPKLAAEAAEDAAEERGHLAAVLARLEFYDIAPAYDHAKPEWPRHDFEGILAANYALETKAMEVERGNVVTARGSGDEITAGVFASLLAGSEEAVAKIEAARRVIEQIGLDNYLAAKI